MFPLKPGPAVPQRFVDNIELKRHLWISSTDLQMDGPKGPVDSLKPARLQIQRVARIPASSRGCGQADRDEPPERPLLHPLRSRGL